MKKLKSVIDEDLQSRQLATYGMSVMERLAGASILIIGANGLGVEVAKNIVLANVGKVTLADDSIASWSDMGTHFYLQPSDVGRTNRAEACRESIQNVNPSVEVVCHVDPVSEQLLAAHDVVCVCDCVCRGEDGPVSFKWNDICRSRGISFIRCEARGVFGYVFDDLSSSGSGSPGIFSVPDLGQTIAHISNSMPAVVTIDQPSLFGSSAGKTVRFSGIRGTTELNGTTAVVDSQQYVNMFGSEKQLQLTLRDVDTRNMGAYRQGGTLVRAPFETVHKFTSFRDAWRGSAINENAAAQSPLVGDLGQLEHPRGLQCELLGLPNLHITRMLRVAFRTLENSPGRRFAPGNEEQAHAFVDEICHEIQLLDPSDFFFEDEFDGSKGVDDREAVVRSIRPFLTTFAMSCAGSLSPVAACVGGIAAQEIIKSVARLAEPLSPFLFFSFVDILPKPAPTFEQVLPRGCRYDSHIAVLGAPFHDELCALKVCGVVPVARFVCSAVSLELQRCVWSGPGPQAASSSKILRCVGWEQASLGTC
jgi:ubiquitin-activating enzyme E1